MSNIISLVLQLNLFTGRNSTPMDKFLPLTLQFKIKKSNINSRSSDKASENLISNQEGENR